MATQGRFDVDAALQAVGTGRLQLLLFVYVGCCWMSDAMEVMIMTVLAPAVACEWGVSPEAQSALASAVFTGMLVASYGCGLAADMAGRRWAFAAAFGLAAAAGFASAAAPSFGVLVALRLLVGAGLVGVLPMYNLMEEWLPAGNTSKGKWMVAMQVWWCVGTGLEALLATWLLNTHGWRPLLAVSAVPLVCLLAVLPLVPESPHTLLALGRPHEARRVLLAAAALNGTLPALQRQLRQQEEEQQQQQQHRGEEQWEEEQQRTSGGQGQLHGAVGFRTREACPTRMHDGPGCVDGSGCHAARSAVQQEHGAQALGRECGLDGPESPLRGARQCAAQDASRLKASKDSRPKTGSEGSSDGGIGGVRQTWSRDPHPAAGPRPSSGSGRASGESSSRLAGSAREARPPHDMRGGAAGGSAPATPRSHIAILATPDARAAAALGLPSPTCRAQSFSVDSSPSSPVGPGGGGGAGWSMRVSASGSSAKVLGSPGGSSRGWRAALLGEGRGSGGGNDSGSGSGGGGGGGSVGLPVVTPGRAAGWGCCRRLYGLWRDLLGPELRGTTLRLGALWFVCALVYYGVVLVLPSVSGGLRHAAQDESGGGGGQGASAVAAADPGRAGDSNGVGASGNALGWACDGSRVVLPYSVYGGMVAASAAELPSFALAAAVVDGWSKRRALAWGMGAAAAALAPVAIAGGRAGGTVGGVDLGPGGINLPSWLPFASVTLARLFVSGGFVLLYVLTPERFPARVRASALGACNSLARIGALAAPFVAVALPQRGGDGGGGVAAALGVLAALSGAATLAAGGLRD